MILACQNINKSFGEHTILKDASFHIEEREKAALIGSNGAGKTTLLRIIIHELPADSGEIILARDKTIGYLAQYQDISTDPDHLRGTSVHQAAHPGSGKPDPFSGRTDQPGIPAGSGTSDETLYQPEP